MTTKKVPVNCDFRITEDCKKTDGIITSEMRYKAQFSQVGKRAKKGDQRKFIKADNNADCCHPCFISICKNGFIPDWTMLIQQEDKTWVTQEMPAEQTQTVI